MYYRLAKQPIVTAATTPKPVTISLNVTKEYDGTPNFYNWHIDVDDFDNAIINGVLDKDFWQVGINKTGVSGILHSAEPGTSGTLVVSGSFALTGEGKKYYLLEQPIVTATITKRGVTIIGKITATKDYDGTYDFSSEHIDISKAKVSWIVDNDDILIDKSGVTGSLTLRTHGDLKLTGDFKLAGADTAKYYLSKQPYVYAEINWESHTVTFSAEEIKYSPQTILYGCKVFKPSDPLRVNCNFGGWFTDNGTFENEWNFATDVVTQDTTLFAKWNFKTFTVSFAGDEIDIIPQTVEYNSKATKPADPVRTEYTFSGWFTGNYYTFENEWDFETNTVTHDITLYAKWSMPTSVVETWYAASDIKIYPNPVKNELWIEIGELTIKRVEILDLSGRVVLLPSFGGDGGGFNVSALSQGVYFARVETDKGIVTVKFFKE
jgi:uncharacterized repeat protein (TIGR02543 family)